MITITINNESIKIPLMNELTVKQFAEFSQTKMNLIDYLSVVLEKSYKEAFNMHVKGLNKLLKRLGNIKDYRKIPVPKKIFIGDDYFYTNRIDISTVGQRFMIEENARKLKNEELLCFILAIGIINDPMDIEKVNKMKDKLYESNYIEVLPTAFFLASRFLIGKSNVMNYLIMLRQLINTKINEIKLGLKSLVPI